MKEEDNKKIISIARWGAFTKSILEICDIEMEIIEIGGNDEILVSIITTVTENMDLNKDSLLYSSNIVTNPERERKVYLLPVNQLLSFVRDAKRNGIEVEHVFDY
jgi:hypothetical protein